MAERLAEVLRSDPRLGFAPAAVRGPDQSR